ncbi:MAG: c-type cytochrome biogenesis protein CcsB [Streptosporangiales bacterium]|nr:c-type cytochrome biogenesis protein CcsB [Streptosporangiales bacterium]
MPAALVPVSDQLMTGAVAAYVLALVLYAFAYGPTRAATTGASPGVLATMPPLAGRFGWLVAAGGACLHAGHLVTLGVAAGRAPWGTMGEFVSALVLSAVVALLVLTRRERQSTRRHLGLFVMLPAVVGIALATTVLYRPLPQLVPALHSYWIVIHVTTAIVAAGASTAGTVFAVLYLVRSRRDADASDDGAGRLPAAEVLNRLAHRTVVFAFPLWTFAIVTGAVWAEAAWGRYWGWDPKETWAFIAWVAYAAYLHARSTAGWKSRRAAVICCVAYACVLFNLVVVNVWLNGLHSYAGL